MKINKPLYYILNIVWGFPLTLIGFVGALALLISGRRPQRNGGGWVFRVGHDWGGISFGLCHFVDMESTERILAHEYGHSLQNMIWGPLMVFVIAIPSVVRYWIRQIRRKQDKPNSPYDAIWFEGQATRWGLQTIGQWKKT